MLVHWYQCKGLTTTRERLILGHPTINGSPFTVDILIGADPYWDKVEDEIIKGPGPTAANSNLGYLLLGSLSMCNPSRSPSTSTLHVMAEPQQEEFDLERFWRIDDG